MPKALHDKLVDKAKQMGLAVNRKSVVKKRKKRKKKNG